MYSTPGLEEPLHLGGPTVLEIQHMASQQQMLLTPPHNSISLSSGLFSQSPPPTPIIYSQPPASNFVSCSQPPPLYSVAFSAAAPPTSIGPVNSVVVSQANPPVVFSQPCPLPGTVVLSQPAPPPPGVTFSQPPPIPGPNLGPFIPDLSRSGDQLIHSTQTSLLPGPPTQTTLQFDVPPPQFEGPNHQPPVPQFDLTQHPPGFSEQGPEMIPQFITPTTQGFNPNQPPPPTSFQTNMPAFVPQFSPPQSQPLTQFQPQPPVQYWMPPN